MHVVSSSYEDLASGICVRPSFSDLSRENISMHTVRREMHFFHPPLTNEINALQRCFKISLGELLGIVGGARKEELSSTNLLEINASPVTKELALFQTSICTRHPAQVCFCISSRWYPPIWFQFKIVRFYFNWM